MSQACDTIIAATDASRDGEMTFRYVYQYLNCTQPCFRLWISSLTDESVRKGMENLKPDIVISDVMMPVMDGIELCKRIKSDINLSHIPVILLTARTDTASKIAGLENGADVYIENPVSVSYL